MPVLDTGSIVAPAPREGGRKRWRILQNRIERARDLRRSGNHAETAVWELLCTHSLGGLRFQRQHAIGPYVVTFACTARKLAIEIDGEPDPRRAQLMEQLGWRVVRFAAGDVVEDPEGIWRRIDRLLHGRP